MKNQENLYSNMYHTLDAVGGGGGGGGLILPRSFHPVHQQVELIGAIWLCLTRTNRSAYAYAKDLIQS